ncbi:MAG: glycosyltransferase [Paludibacteraceae bacterium]|nr:glycosyltransferase [Paludibacteraceae bacterium]MBR5375330.1 glycosyltransferase [Paludibacteraceae bacterium]
MNGVKVSVITVVYNDVANIERTITDTLSQTYDNLEYIVVDGGSTDGTLEIIKKYADRIIWKSESDKGIYDAMMKGVRMASGEWILFRNSGDLFFDGAVIERVFSEYEDRGEAFIAGNIRYLKGDSYKDLHPNILTCDYYDAMPFHHPSTFVRRSVQLKFPFDLKYKNSADYKFFIQSLNAGMTYRCINTIVAVFDANYGASTSNYILSLKENIDILLSLGAPDKSVKSRRNVLRKESLKKKISRIPFLSYLIDKYTMGRGKWQKV